MTFSRTFIAISFLALLSACSSNNGGGNGGGTNTVVVCPGLPGTPCNPGNGGATVTVPVCDANALLPFVPVGPSSRIAQLPVGSYRYNGGDVYAETSNQNPQTQIAIADDQPNNPAYPGTLKCLTNLGGNIPAFDTGSGITRNLQVTPSQFVSTGDRRGAASFQNGTLQSLVFDGSSFVQKTPLEIDSEQSGREAPPHNWSINVYRLSATEFKIVIIRTFSYMGVNGNLFVAARYTYTP